MNIEIELNLVALSKTGDKAAYGKLVTSYSKYVYAICYGILKSAHDAEDVSQEALVKGFTRIANLKENKQFKSWLGQISRNLCIDLIRKHKRKKEVSSDEMLDINTPIVATEKTQNEALHIALKQLPEHYREPLILYYLEQKETPEIADILEISPAGVGTRLSRARKQLRTILNKEEALYE